MILKEDSIMNREELLRGQQLPIEPECPDGEYAIYSMPYQQDFFDKIFYTKAPEELTNLLLQHKDTNHPWNNFLAGDIKEETRVMDYGDETEISKKIKPFIHKQISQILRGIKEDEFEVNGWINLMKPTEYNPLHNHDGNYSFVWYLDVNEEIRNEWKQQISNSTSRGLIEFPSKVGHGHLVFNPRANDFLMFNSDQSHAVYPFYSDHTRISFAGNIKIK